MQKIILGNWKMHKTASEALAFCQHLLQHPVPEGCLVGVAPPFTALSTMCSVVKDSWLHLGAQNLHDQLQGAFTGEISANMLLELNVEFVLVGHSERRGLLQESDKWIHEKLVRALDAGLQVVLCVGESAADRDAGRMPTILAHQISQALQGRSSSSKVWIAYEPIWAIGTGVVADAEAIAEATAFCKECVRTLWPDFDIPILYGGSVHANNIAEVFRGTGVSGVLVGGASLDPYGFYKLISAIQSLENR